MAKKKKVEDVKPVEPVKKEPVKEVKPPYPQPKKKSKYGWLSREA